MKKIFVLGFAFLIYGSSFAQPGKKPPQKDNPPTQKEMENMMKEMQKEMEGMSAEDKKMMDSMGIKIPSMKDIPKLSDKQLADAWENENRIIPVKDNERIASISKTQLTSATLPAYLQTVYERITPKLNPTEFGGEKVYQLIKEKYKTATSVGNAAVAYWMMGKPEMALYLMNRACKDDPNDVDNLNNFSAFLTMTGAEQLAIPLLDHLNKRFPQNSTILNNMGQAWFGLGDADKANKYLDSAIRIYAYHPQANLTKSLIEESKGNKQGAIDAVKRSIAEAYSMEKENRVNKMGYKLKTEDITWDRPMPQDALGLEKFKWPEYPMNVAESEVLEVEWDAFKKKCQEEIDELRMLEKRLELEAQKANDALTKEVLSAGRRGVMVDPVPRFAHKAMIKLNYLVDDRDGHISFSYQQKLQAIANANIEAAKFEDILSNQIKVLDEKYEDQFGEGKPNPFDAACADDTKAKNSFLSSSNSLLRNAFSDFLSFMRRKINNEMYYYQYTMWPENFELAKVQAKIGWLNLIKSQKPKFKDKSSWCRENSGDKEEKPFTLSKFDDLNCNYHSEAKLIIGTISSDCNKLTIKMDLDFIKLGMVTKEGDRDDESFMEKFQSCSIEIGVKEKVGFGEGPLKAEAKVGISGFVEIDKTGISDAGVKVVAEANVGTNVIRKNGVKIEPIEKISKLGPGVAGDQSLTVIGTEAKLSVLSGFSVAGKGILKGLKK